MFGISPELSEINCFSYLYPNCYGTQMSQPFVNNLLH